MHECDSKMMMYNFNIRRNIAQQEKGKKKKERQNEYRMCKRKENKQQRHQQTEKKIFSFHFSSRKHTWYTNRAHTVISGRIKSRINYA